MGGFHFLPEESGRNPNHYSIYCERFTLHFGNGSLTEYLAIISSVRTEDTTEENWNEPPPEKTTLPECYI